MRSLFVTSLLAGFILGAVALGTPDFDAFGQDETTSTTSATETHSVPATSESGSHSAPNRSESGIYPAVEVVKKVGSAVVTVINEQTSTGPGTSGSRQPVGFGTRFFIDAQGDIVTNWHVVYQGQEFQVVLANDETRDATLIGSDEISDVGVVRVSGDLPSTVAFGDSSILQPGEPVLAIGSPLGAFTNTVTEGIVSAVGPDFPQDRSQGPQVNTNLIQHDEAINPGNSGGALFTLRGEVVGVDTLGIPSENGQPVQGLFLAIPSNTVKEITEQLIRSGKVTYSFFGVSTQTVTADVAAQVGLKVDHGEYVLEVMSTGPAEAAGIKPDDVILSIDGQELDQQHSFAEVLFTHKPGDTVTVKISRGGEAIHVNVTLAERLTVYRSPGRSHRS